MLKNKTIYLFVVSTVLLILLDFAYLYINKEWYISETEKSQSAPFQIKWGGVFLRYLSQSIGLNIFILQQNASIFHSFLYGLVIYSNYIGTNYATIKMFDETLASVDLLKGGIIMMLTTYLTYVFVE